MSIAENLRRIRAESGLTQEEFGRVAGVSAMAVSQWENGRAVPRMGAVQRIADHFGVNKGAVIDEETDAVGSFSVRADGDATVPLVTLGSVHAGPFSEEGETERSIDVPASLLRSHPRARALIVEGDCMNRVAPEGMAVVYDPDVEPHNGSIAIVETENYDAVMRRWYRGGDTLMLVADSYGKHPDIVLTEEDGPIKLVGTVVWVQSAREMD